MGVRSQQVQDESALAADGPRPCARCSRTAGGGCTGVLIPPCTLPPPHTHTHLSPHLRAPIQVGDVHKMDIKTVQGAGRSGVTWRVGPSCFPPSSSATPKTVTTETRVHRGTSLQVPPPAERPDAFTAKYGYCNATAVVMATLCWRHMAHSVCNIENIENEMKT